jgi:hypothetical protein
LDIGVFPDAPRPASGSGSGRRGRCFKSDWWMGRMVELSGIEPLTSSLRTTRSPN